MKRFLKVENQTRSTLLGDRIVLADRWWLRLTGLLGRVDLPKGEGLLITPCKAIHMLGMRIPLDVVVLNQDSRVVGVYPGLLPGAKTGWHRDARCMLEVPVGTVAATGTLAGDQLRCESFAAAIAAGIPAAVEGA